jgi:integrase
LALSGMHLGFSPSAVGTVPDPREPGARQGKFPAAPHIELLDESENVREGFLEPPEFEAVCAALPGYVQDAARFAYLTGWRVGAIRALEWRDVDLRARTLRLRAAHAKNRRAMLLPLTAALLELIERRVAAGDLACPFVFPGAAGGRLGDFRKAWKRACATAGVPEQVVMEVGGWRTRAMLARYNVTSERDLGERSGASVATSPSGPRTPRKFARSTENGHRTATVRPPEALREWLARA